MKKFLILLLLIYGSASAETKVISGTTNLEDARISGASPENNYGGSTVIITDAGNNVRTLIRVKNVASELGPGVTITACVCSLYCALNTVDGSVSAYRVLKPWVEGIESGVNDDDGDVTFVDWASDDFEWGTAGCNNANDLGTDNSGDGSGFDRWITAEDTENVTTVNTWYAWNISTVVAQGWYSGHYNEEGIILIDVTGGENVFHSTESAESQKPFWTFTYKIGQVIMVR